MKKVRKYTKIIIALMLLAITFVASIKNVSAANETIQLGTATQVENAYIGGVTFSYKVTTSGEYLYCLNIHKKTATNVVANRVTGSSYINGGLVHILKNGYPYKNITGVKDKDYYITQTAIWWYLDSTTGSTNLGERFKLTGSDNYDLRKYVKQLVNEGIAHRNDPITTADTRLVISTTDVNMVLKNGYYTSNDIKATDISNISSYNITLTNAPAETIISKNGVDMTYNGTFTLNSNDIFRIKVKASSIKDTTAAIKVIATGKGISQYTAYEYQPVNTDMQHVTKLEKEEKVIGSEIILNIISSKVSVTKVDTNTKKAIAGAKFVLINEQGKELTSWTSTTNAHIIRNLPNGTYTLKETVAPTGYLLNKNESIFTVSDNNRDIKITFEDAPKKVVVNITKVDQATNNSLAGAVIVVRNASGAEVARFTTTNESYVLTDLADGVYTVEEESAPAGYIKTNDKVSFTIDDSHLSHQIIMVNAKEVVVPDTASSTSIILLFIGIVISGAGIEYIYKNRKHAK